MNRDKYLVHLTEQLYNPSYAIKKLFKQAREGLIAKLLGNEPRLGERITYKHQRRLTAEQKAMLVDNYKAGGHSIYSLAKIWNISPHTVSTHLRKAGLSIGFKPLSYAEIAEARELRKEGMSFNAIGRRLSRDPKTVKNALN
jgi:DNA-binding CsgD family transcriptional regulator